MRLLLSYVVFMLTFLAVGMALIRADFDRGDVLIIGFFVSLLFAVLGYALSAGYEHES